MRDKIIQIWDEVRSSYWFIPSMCVLLVSFLAVALPELENSYFTDRHLGPWLRTTTVGARSVLSSIAGAMVTLTGTVFSITIVTLSLTSQQFGPRLLRNFMEDTLTQLTLGVFVSTALYSLLLLQFLEDNPAPSAHPPHLAIFLAVVFVGLSIGFLIVYIHHTAISIQAPHLIASVARELDFAIDRLYPHPLKPEIPRENVSSDSEARGVTRPPESRSEICFELLSPFEGYVQLFDFSELLSIAEELNCVIELHAMQGDFLTKDRLFGYLYADRKFGEKKIKRVNDAIRGSLVVGTKVTPRQDIRCPIDEIVEVALRALSPGVNDTFTALQCIDRLTASLSRLIDRDLRRPLTLESDPESLPPRIILPTISFSQLMDAAFSKVRHSGQASPAIVGHLQTSLLFLAEYARTKEQKKIIWEHSEILFRCSERFSEESDRLLIAGLSRKVRSRLGKRDHGSERTPLIVSNT